ncbi:uncharacterized protein LOC106465080 [Limulus polyphemus]|uniref:Uncharacterized protein LOC106465080 n=1 Tax=Limulus polyphemus TaxID=6850 RepID=A0ABM1BF47_LIMPO|nr:uncharacterized protein LOC106465080 [Limulus polyphemus]
MLVTFWPTQPDGKNHLKILRELFRRVRAAGLAIRPSKCYIGYFVLDFVGHKVGDQQITMKEEELTHTQNSSALTTKQQVISFLELVGYYRKFIPNYAEVSAPLTDLTKKGQPNKVKWKQLQHMAFQKFKNMLGSLLILIMRDLNKPFIIQADVGIGAVLLQEHVDGLLP